MGESDRTPALRLQCTETRLYLTQPGSVKVLYLGTTETTFLHSVLIFFPISECYNFMLTAKEELLMYYVSVMALLTRFHSAPLSKRKKLLFYLKCLSWPIPSPYTQTEVEEKRKQCPDPKSSNSQKDSELRSLFKKKTNKSLKKKSQKARIKNILLQGTS